MPRRGGGENFFQSVHMVVQAKLLGLCPSAVAELVVMNGVRQSAHNRIGQASYSCRIARRELPGLAWDQPIRDSTDCIAGGRNAEGSSFNAHQPKRLRPQTRN